ncbi:MAG: ribonuclease III [Gammaproteobacteria bacterium]
MKLANLTKKLKYEFQDLQLLQAALTHRSVPGYNNERLEFLGDSILNCIIASALFKQFPEAKEGELSRLRANLVKGETLAQLAQEFELNRYLRLGVGELRSGGAKRESTLADALEAIIGAIYLESGFSVIETLVLNWFDSRFKALSISANLKDPKTQLQEYLQARKHALPTYKMITVKGEAHAQTFYMECSIPKLKLSAQGQGSTRRKAEQEAAQKILAKLHE